MRHTKQTCRANGTGHAGTRAILLSGLVLLALALPNTAWSAHPLITEDTATQGRGRFELEVGNAWTRDGADRSYELGPQLSYGVLPQLDAILRPAWLDQRTTLDADTVRAHGPGDAAADLKWRFFERGKLSLALRAGVNAPTGDADQGLGTGKTTYHGVLVASMDLAPLTLHTNIGYTRNRSDPAERRDLYHASAALLWTINDTWRVLLTELATDTHVDNTRSTPPSVVRVGAIYSVVTGFDIDVGYQARLNGAAARQAVLVGLTSRWGP